MEKGLPADIMVDICRRLGASDFRNLVGMLFASHVTWKFATSDDVLRVANIDEFKRRAWKVKEGTKSRPFFKRCVDAKNGMALVLEGLRLAFQIGDLDGAIKMIEQSTQSMEHGKIVIYSLGMLQICSGEYETGMETLKGLNMEFEGIREADLIALDVCEAICQMNPKRQGSFYKTYNCPDAICDCESQDYTYDYPRRCYDCFVHWHSSLLCDLS